MSLPFPHLHLALWTPGAFILCACPSLWYHWAVSGLPSTLLLLECFWPARGGLLPPVEDWDCRLSHGLLTSLGHSEIISICWGQLVLRISFVSQLIPWKIFSSRCHCAICSTSSSKTAFPFYHQDCGGSIQSN